MGSDVSFRNPYGRTITMRVMWIVIIIVFVLVLLA